MATKKKAVIETEPSNGGLSVEEPVVKGEFDGIPTVEEARAMFEARPDLASVVTVQGTLNRDGSFATQRTLGLDGIWR